MTAHLRLVWSQTVAQHEAASWRGLVADPVWIAAPAVIMVDKLARRSTYEVYVNGRQVSREWRLDDAKARAEKEIGEACTWVREATERVMATHWYFGETEEFTDPLIVYKGTPVIG